jgi:dienelactone hydrolase
MRMRALVLGCLLLCACASPPPQESVAVQPAPAARAPSIPIEVLRPEGAGPFPAVVMLHDCSRLGPRSSGAPARWASVLAREGYVVLIPDSFSTRGHPNGVCVDPSPSRFEVGPYRRVADAYEALAYARTLLAAVALYPGCGAPFGEWNPPGAGVYKPLAPLLILVGDKDDWTPAEPCRRLAERSREAGFPVTLKIYPGAHHAFDSAAPVRYLASRVNPNVHGGRGATTGGNPEAWADSIREVLAFFGRHLRDSPR